MKKLPNHQLCTHYVSCIARVPPAKKEALHKTWYMSRTEAFYYAAGLKAGVALKGKIKDIKIEKVKKPSVLHKEYAKKQIK